MPAGGVAVEHEKNFAKCPFLAFMPADAREVVALNSAQQRAEPAFDFLKDGAIAAAVLLPLFAEDRNLGLLCFTTAARDTITEEEIVLLTTIAQCLAIALDREQTNKKLQVAQEQLRGHAQLLEKTVQERTAQLQATVSELETFSYAVAHDLREPVRGLTGFCEVLLEDFNDLLPPEARNVVERLTRTSRRMETLTRDLLAFSSVSRQQIHLTRVEIEPIIKDILALRPPALRDSVSLPFPFHAALAHATLLQQVLSNLIDNAVKFVVPETPPKITIWTELVPQSSPNTRSAHLLFSSVDKFPQANPPAADIVPATRVRIWVADEGIGIAPEMHQKVFGIFERGVQSEQYEGTGMGLAIVARAVQRMGGTCGVESEQGKGSRFWIELLGG